MQAGKALGNDLRCIKMFGAIVPLLVFGRFRVLALINGVLIS